MGRPTNALTDLGAPLDLGGYVAGFHFFLPFRNDIISVQPGAAPSAFSSVRTLCVPRFLRGAALILP